jgi:hypothetical protein
MKEKAKHSRRCSRAHAVTTIAVAFFVVIMALPVFAGVGRTGEGQGGQPPALVELTSILERLDTELERLGDDQLPALEEQVEGILELLEELSEALAASSDSDEARPQIKEQLVKLDLMLHRLVVMLERIAKQADEAPRPSPEKEKAQDVLGELRRWVDGYIAGATRHMSRSEAKQFEKTTKAMLGEIAKQLIRIGQRARENQPGEARLEILIERIEALLARLDRFIIRSFGRPPTKRPLPQAP